MTAGTPTCATCSLTKVKTNLALRADFLPACYTANYCIPPRVPCLICLRLLPAWLSDNKRTMSEAPTGPPPIFPFLAAEAAIQINQPETPSSLASLSPGRRVVGDVPAADGCGSSLLPPAPAAAKSVDCQLEAPIQTLLPLHCHSPLTVRSTGNRDISLTGQGAASDNLLPVTLAVKQCVGMSQWWDTGESGTVGISF